MRFPATIFLFFDANRLSILLLEAVGILFTLICFFSFMFLISSKVYPSSFLRVDAAMKDQQKCSSNQEMAFLIINPFIVASIFWRSSLLLRFVISNPLLFSTTSNLSKLVIIYYLYILPYPPKSSFLSLVKNCNHKGLGIYYLLSAFIFGISGSLISVLIRIELYSSGNRIISPENQNFYNISITLGYSSANTLL